MDNSTKPDETAVKNTNNSGATALGYSVSDVRSALLKVLLGCLVAAAAIAVLAILAGSMGQVAWRSIGTVTTAAIHIVILFAILNSVTSKTSASSNVLINAAFGVAILSFFTSVFNVWGVIGGETVSKLYATYIILLVALLHVKVLMDVKESYLPATGYVVANYVFIGLVTALILGIIYLPESGQLLSGFYGRLLAASVVVDVTLSIVVAVMHRIFLQKHPELAEKSEVRHSSGRLVVLIILFGLVLWPVITLIASFGRHSGW